MARRTYTRRTSTSAAGSQKPTFKDYGIETPAVCGGCGRRLVAAHEPSLWFVGYPVKAVYGACCSSVAASNGRKP